MITNYRPEIDGLRALAVAFVIVFHAFPDALPGGFVGVDIFFVISGYLITGIIIKEVGDGSFRLLTFYQKRARRIFPALVVVLGACLCAGWLILLADEFQALGKHVAGGAGFVANLILLTEAGYFDVSAYYKPLLHLWSLGVEEQFYILWPLALLAASAFGWMPAGIALAAICISGLASVWLTQSDPSAAYYLPYSRFWEIMVGAIVALMRPMRIQRKLVVEVGVVAGLLLIVCGAVLVTSDFGFPAPAAIIPTSGAILIIALGQKSSVAKIFLANRISVWIGLISYPLYLWHWPLLSFPTIMFGREPSWRVACLAVLLSVLLALATFIVVERPVRTRLSLRMASTVFTLLLGAVLSLGLLTFWSGGVPSRSAIVEAEAVQDAFEGSLWRYTSNQICLERYRLPDQENYGWWFCVTNDDRAPNVLLIGNSFANHYYAGFVENPAFANKTILSLGSCDPAKIYESEVHAVEDTVSPCTPQRRWDQQQLVDAVLKDSHPLDIVVISGIAANPTPEYIARLSDRIESIIPHVDTVVLAVPHVVPDYHTKACFGRPFVPTQESCKISKDVHRALIHSVNPLVEEVKAKFPDILIFDPNAAFCDSVVCSFVDEGMPMFRDEYAHFSTNGSKKVVSELARLLQVNSTP